MPITKEIQTMSAIRLTPITSTLLLVAIGAFSSSAHAADLRLQVGTTPGFDSIKENATGLYGGEYSTAEREMNQDAGLSVGLIMTWAKPEGVSFLRGLEVSYRTDGGSNSSGSFETAQFGVGGRLGVGWVITPGLRLEGGGRAMIGYAETDNAIDSVDGNVYQGNTIIVASNQSATGLGYQFGAFVGVNYTFEKHFMIGAELGYEYTGALLDATYLTSEVSGAGATFALNAGYSF
jgi:hypothetical protein